MMSLLVNGHAVVNKTTQGAISPTSRCCQLMVFLKTAASSLLKLMEEKKVKT